MKDSAKLCAQTQHQPAPLSDYHVERRPGNALGSGKAWEYVPRHIRQRSASSGIRRTTSRAGVVKKQRGG